MNGTKRVTFYFVETTFITFANRADPDQAALAYPGSEFVVANTLAKWKKLEPNEINFSKVLARKYQQVVLYIFNSLPAMSADNLCKQFG